jgi:hypothetical protein
MFSPRLSLMRTLFLLLAVTFAASSAQAQMIIRSDDHPRHRVELEPHGTLTWFAPPGELGGAGLGGGFRASITIADSLIPRVNDSAAISFGGDLVHYFGAGVAAGNCAQYVGTGADRICVRVAGSTGPGLAILAPIEFQWNFYLTPKWSVFGELGVLPYLGLMDGPAYTYFSVVPAVFVGGRYHFNDRASLTMRLGYPFTTIGVSFFP